MPMGFGLPCCDGTPCNAIDCPDCGSPRNTTLNVTAPGSTFIRSYTDPLCAPDSPTDLPVVLTWSGDENNPNCYYIGGAGPDYRGWHVTAQIYPAYAFGSNFVHIGWWLSINWRCTFPPGSPFIPGGGGGALYFLDDVRTCIGTYLKFNGFSDMPGSVAVS